MAQGVPLGSIPLEQLRQIREELERETEVLQENVRALRGAQERLLASKLNAESFGNEEAGTNAMVPLTASLYVPGKIVNPSKVLVDLGTGYYAEVSHMVSRWFGRLEEAGTTLDTINGTWEPAEVR
mmetsp:Transcript_18048/g.37467  ORF Transcript_18048/g.37467 Transcript_18048/m.37467 type:complete len:126 (-) Transcript_18048:638-1015(-)